MKVYQKAVDRQVTLRTCRASFIPRFQGSSYLYMRFILTVYIAFILTYLIITVIQLSQSSIFCNEQTFIFLYHAHPLLWFNPTYTRALFIIVT